MKKETLKLSRLDKDNNVLLYTIVSAESELQVCRSINYVLGISLTLSDELIIADKTTDVCFKKYYFEKEDAVEKYFLFVNRSQNHFLLPELKKIDYIFLIISESLSDDFTNSIQLLKKDPGITAVFKIDPSSLKSFRRIQF